jgi:hypothetical protein
VKTAVAVTLITACVVVVAIPPLPDAWRTHVLARLMGRGATSVNLEGQLGELYRLGCWLLGAMVGLGTVASSKRTSESRASTPAADAE